MKWRGHREHWSEWVGPVEFNPPHWGMIVLRAIHKTSLCVCPARLRVGLGRRQCL